VELEKPLGAIGKIFVRRTDEQPLPENTVDFSELSNAPSRKPDHTIQARAVSCLMYTSGTTGFPKGVVVRNVPGAVNNLKGTTAMIFTAEDIIYTALPLFHANALNLSAGWAMGAGIPLALDRRFSASRFWNRIRYYGATEFNGIGSMIPILMKQPERENDADNKVRLVISAACPTNLWEPFEKRFGLTLWEGYGAVDGGGIGAANFGNAPTGSVGKPGDELDWKLVDNDDNEVAKGDIGELIGRFKGERKASVEYYKNPEASAEKVKDGWVRSGDLFYADSEDNLYFVDRKTDSMRRRGENISSWEVENIVEKYPDVAECAAFGVPSELGEDEVMIWVKPNEGRSLDLEDLTMHCAKNMAHFMVPRYIDMVEDIPRTGTIRVQKTALKKQGVSDSTWDREKEMPDLELKKM